MSMFGNAFKPGGAGRDVAGYIGDALLTIGGGHPMYAPMKADIRNQQNMLARQEALDQFKLNNPQPTELQRNYEYLRRTNPALAETYLRSEANPMTLTTDPLTGNLRFTPKGGDPSIAPMPGQPQGPITKTIGTKTYYSPNGTDWYDNPGMQ